MPGRAWTSPLETGCPALLWSHQATQAWSQRLCRDLQWVEELPAPSTLPTTPGYCELVDLGALAPALQQQGTQFWSALLQLQVRMVLWGLPRGHRQDTGSVPCALLAPLQREARGRRRKGSLKARGPALTVSHASSLGSAVVWLLGNPRGYWHAQRGKTPSSTVPGPESQVRAGSGGKEPPEAH